MSLTAGTESPAYDLEGPNGNVKGVDTDLLHVVTIRDDSLMRCTNVTLRNKLTINARFPLQFRRERRRFAALP